MVMHPPLDLSSTATVTASSRRRQLLYRYVQAAQEALKQLTTERPEGEALPEIQVSRKVDLYTTVPAAVYQTDTWRDAHTRLSRLLCLACKPTLNLSILRTYDMMIPDTPVPSFPWRRAGKRSLDRGKNRPARQKDR